METGGNVGSGFEVGGVLGEGSWNPLKGYLVALKWKMGDLLWKENPWMF